MTVAGLMGAAGVGLAAAAAHLAGDTTGRTAADFLLFHAPAVLMIGLWTSLRPHRGLLAAGALIALGAVLFSGDLAIRVFAGLRLVPMAAPTGGMMMIVGWIATAVTAPMAETKAR